MSQKNYLIGIDIGTSGTKSVLFDLDGAMIASATASYPLYQPENGYAEQNPNDWWNAVCETLSVVTRAAKGGKICAVGLSGQMHGLVMLDENDRVIRNAILWCDGRTGAECREIEKTIGREKLIQITGNPAITGFTAESLLWVRQHEPETYRTCRRILLPKDYIRYKLTGVFATEASDASGTQLFDIAKRCWSEEVCESLDIDMCLLPTVLESADVSGYIAEDAARFTGLPIGIPVAGGASDNAAAALGSGIYQSGKAFTTIGTSGVLCAHTDRPVIHKDGGIHTFCSAVRDGWLAMGCTQAAGLSLRWFRENLAQGLSYRELDERCERVPIGARRLLYFPALMGELTPVFDENARGAFIGLSALHGVDEMARAVMEGVTYSFYTNLLTFESEGIETTDMTFCGGGAKSVLWRQILADVYALPIKTLLSPECAVLGAAILAGCAAGLYGSIEEACRRTVKTGEITEPDDTAHETYLRPYDVYRHLHGALKKSFKELKAIE